MPGRDIIVLGASFGGVVALQSVISTLPSDFEATICVVLHTTSAECPGPLPEILNRTSKLPVLYAAHNAPIYPSAVNVAPAGQRHLLVDRGKLRLQAGPRENCNRPSIDALFGSASQAYGSQVIGVVLTGYLDDGSAGLADLKNRGRLAIAQDPEEAVAPSMPSTAIEATEVDFVLPVERIGPKLIELAASEIQNRSRQFPVEAEISP